MHGQSCGGDVLYERRIDKNIKKRKKVLSEADMMARACKFNTLRNWGSSITINRRASPTTQEVQSEPGWDGLSVPSLKKVKGNENVV